LLTLVVDQSAAEPGEGAASNSGGNSLLGKLGSFKSLVSKKPREASAAA
jgi:hypothetical protein